VTQILPHLSTITESSIPCPDSLPWCNKHSVTVYPDLSESHVHWGHHTVEYTDDTQVELQINHTGDPAPGDLPYVHMSVTGPSVPGYCGGSDSVQGELPTLMAALAALTAVTAGVA
jgi:hypothetical protein